ncbi:MAG: CPBP family intramembrane metalloprotease [Candidatus Diapherotrites archaeon]|nr:CPBP family intramembrane metalloprotease [Candidatus Diapherotrites archaeon]
MFVVQILLAITLSQFASNDLELVSELIKSLSPYFLIYVLIVRVFAEEVFFRGFLSKKLEEATFKKTNVKWLGLLFASIIFAFAHFTYGSFYEIMGAMALGFVLGYVYLKSNSLVVSTVAHVLYNAIVITAIMFS